MGASYELSSSKPQLNGERNHSLPLEDTTSGLELHENFQLLSTLLIPALRGTKHQQRSSHGFHRLRNYREKFLKMMLPPPPLQLCSFQEVDLQLPPAVGNALTCAVLLQKSEVADEEQLSRAQSEHKAVSK